MQQFPTSFDHRPVFQGRMFLGSGVEKVLPMEALRSGTQQLVPAHSQRQRGRGGLQGEREAISPRPGPHWIGDFITFNWKPSAHQIVRG